MGLAASQGRLLMLTMRQSDVEGQLQFVANQRLSLSRQSSNLSSEHNKALSARKLEWSVDGNSSNLTYDLIMAPTAANIANQYLVADANGRVILNDSYADLLGGQGVNSGSAPLALTKENFLINKMGITSTDAQKYINNYVSSTTPIGGGTTVDPAMTLINISTLIADITDITSEFPGVSVGEYPASGNGFPVDDTYTVSTPCYEDMRQKFKDLQTNLNSFKTSSAYQDYTATQKSYVNNMLQNIDLAIFALDDAKSSGDKWNRAGDLAAIKVVFEGQRLGMVVQNTDWGGRDNGEANAYDHADDILHQKITNYNGSIPYSNNMLDMLELVTKINSTSGSPNGGGVATPTKQDIANYYINLYNQIEKGWVRNSAIGASDGKYLQNLILNGSAFLYKCNNGAWSLSSSSDANSPVRNVADEEAISTEEANYEAMKDRLDYKEKMLDVEQNNLDTERASIVTEMESVQKIIDTNIKKFKMFEA